MNKAKQFVISQTIVREAFYRVKASKGFAGIDRQFIEEFEQDLEGNLYKLWNRMSSGTYFPPAESSAQVSNASGAARNLGLLKVADRVAQAVVILYLQPEFEPKLKGQVFDSGLGKTAFDAVAVARGRCLERDWVLHLDLRAAFAKPSKALVIEKLKEQTSCQWILLYVQRWLSVAAQQENESQGGVLARNRKVDIIAPLLGDIVLHHVFDAWMESNFPSVPFTRGAGEALVHCQDRKQADCMKDAIGRKLSESMPEVNETKLKIVYCKDSKRSGSSEHEQFDFLGYSFRPRLVKKAEQFMVAFTPAMSAESGKKIREEMRSWRLNMRSDKSLEELALEVNPKVQRWIDYYGRFHKSAMKPSLEKLNDHLVKWAMRKYKRFHGSPRRAQEWIAETAQTKPELFAHWRFGVK